MQNDDFYIGYAGGIPGTAARAVIAAIALAIAGATLSASLFVLSQQALAEATVEFGVRRTFSGYLDTEPAPVLLVADGERLQPYWLVGPGKFGAHDVLSGTRPGWVTLDGSLIEREAWRMIEVVEGTVRPDDRRAHRPHATSDPGRAVVVRGEIVDSKCYLGVMNPGERTVHRDCATRCLAGGVTPMFAYQDAAGSHLALLLASRIEPTMIGRPVTVSGRLSGSEEALVLTLSDEF